MQVGLIITSILLIALVLLQAGKAEEGSVLTGGSSDLFKHRKERGGELFITRFTFSVGAVYFIICFIQGF